MVILSHYDCYDCYDCYNRFDYYALISSLLLFFLLTVDHVIFIEPLLICIDLSVFLDYLLISWSGISTNNFSRSWVCFSISIDDIEVIRSRNWILGLAIRNSISFQKEKKSKGKRKRKSKQLIPTSNIP